MRKLILAACIVLAVNISCTSKKEEPAASTQANSTTVKTDGPTIDKNSEITVLDTIEWHGGTYYAEIHRYPANDSASILEDELGDLYADNCIMLTITRNGKTFYKNLFRKSTFRNQVPNEFYGRFRLNGLVFDKIVPQGMQFAASIGNPSQDDEYLPYNIIISSSGTMSITKSSELDTSAKDAE